MSSADLPRPDASSSLPGRNPDVIEAQCDRLWRGVPGVPLSPAKAVPRAAEPPALCRSGIAWAMVQSVIVRVLVGLHDQPPPRTPLARPSSRERMPTAPESACLLVVT